MLTSQKRKIIVQAARSQNNTRYIKDARAPFSGIDCVGLLAYSYGQVFPQALDAPLQGFCTGFTDDRLLKHLLSYGFRPTLISKALPGDVVVLKYREVPHHTAILTEQHSTVWNMIHACAKYGKVSEHTLTGEWQRRFHSVWSLDRGQSPNTV